jgi:translocator protein
MLPSWLIIHIIMIVVGVGINRLLPTNYRWFNRLIRPQWLTFEFAIPFIWITIFVCSAWSAYNVWEKAPHSQATWYLMAGYLLLEIVTMSYTPVMCRLRSLKVGTIIGLTGFFVALILAINVFPISQIGGFLLLPYLLWSPIGTYVTWRMIYLNPYDA